MSQFYIIRGNVFTFVVLLFSVLLGVSLFSCKKEDTAFSYKDLGLFQLLPESIDQLPYKGKSIIVFVDSLNNKVKFNIDEGDIHTYMSSIEHYNVFEDGDTVVYDYRSEYKPILIFNDSLSVKLGVRLTAEPLYETPDIDVVADVLSIWYINLNSQNSSTRVLNHVMNLRTWPSFYNGHLIDKIEILGDRFYNVVDNLVSHHKSTVRFNFEFGIISFVDLQGKVWKFEKFY